MCVMKGDYEIVKLLVEARASLEARDENDRTPTILAKEEHEIKIWRYLQRSKKNTKERKLEILRST